MQALLILALVFARTNTVLFANASPLQKREAEPLSASSILCDAANLTISTVPLPVPQQLETFLKLALTQTACNGASSLLEHVLKRETTKAPSWSSFLKKAAEISQAIFYICASKSGVPEKQLKALADCITDVSTRTVVIGSECLVKYGSAARLDDPCFIVPNLTDAKVWPHARLRRAAAESTVLDLGSLAHAYEACIKVARSRGKEVAELYSQCNQPSEKDLKALDSCETDKDFQKKLTKEFAGYASCSSKIGGVH